MRGYTLLELLVVLLLLALVTGLIMPRLSNLYESAVRAFQREDLLQQISGLGYQAYQQGKTWRLGEVEDEKKNAELEPPLTAPEGWTISAGSPIDYYPNGVCTGGIITLQQGPFNQQWHLKPPLCQPEP
ncbi:prepilin-type N-terminal cleavage/methylation domain-containing protein [Methylovulum sp.]|uniref:prepilin-type N-terminal cleavage/methylation domain-containing protein n=1 Tax=Methylovulum sp. TaxID=1916980 RepID=UPI00260D85C8|nr:prepilin-type N-terminal cleavage/methylation domain-containing protein [Methylovulum sp.]MDD5123596.1 prepilin-type N-terminal cleavage/methylation domain-containing protein [Methylovulum sp.]